MKKTDIVKKFSSNVFSSDKIEKLNLTSHSPEQKEKSRQCDYWCCCSVCKGLENASKTGSSVNYAKMLEDNQVWLKENIKRWGGRAVSFIFLLERLVSNNPRIKGCPISIPEIILFHSCKPKCFFKYEKKENEITRIDTPAQLKSQCLTRMMMREYRVRRRGGNYPPKVADTAGFKKADDSPVWLRGCTMAIVRYYNRASFTRLSDNEFLELMMQRSGSHVWDDILSIQNYVVTPRSPAEMMIYKFIAPINQDKPEDEINYSLFDANLQTESEDVYNTAKQMCTTIGFYLSKVHSIELLYMKATFLRDDRNSLYFQHAEEIIVRRNKNRIEERKFAEKMNSYSVLTKNAVMRELESYKKTANKDIVETLEKLMQQNFELLKKSAGLISANSSKLDTLQVDEAFRQLRPSSPYRLSEMLRPEFNPRSVFKKDTRGSGLNPLLKKKILEGSPEDVKKEILYDFPSRPCSVQKKPSIYPKRSREKAVFHRSLYELKHREYSPRIQQSPILDLSEYGTVSRPQIKAIKNIKRNGHSRSFFSRVPPFTFEIS